MSIVFKFFDFALKFIKVLVWEGANTSMALAPRGSYVCPREFKPKT
jgi:hypothetical protein